MKFKAGDKVRARLNSGLAGTVEFENSDGVVRFVLDKPTQHWATRETITCQNTALVLDYAFMDSCPAPVVDETFYFMETRSDSGVFGGKTTATFKGLVKASANFGGGELKVELADAFHVAQARGVAYRLTLTPVLDPLVYAPSPSYKFKAGDPVRLAYRPPPAQTSDYAYFQGTGVVTKSFGNGMYNVAMDTGAREVSVYEEALEHAAKRCPFCGGRPTDDGSTLTCLSCRQAAPYGGSRRERLDAWNRRVS